MKYTTFLLSQLVVLCFPLFTASLASAGDLHAASVAVDLQLPEGVPMAGYGAGKRRFPLPLFNPAKYSHFFKAAKGELDPIRGKVLLLEKDGLKLLWIGVDLVAAPPQLIDYIADRTASIGLSADRILVSASHTHSGPGAFADNRFWAIVAVDKYRRELFEYLADRIVEGVFEANAHMAPAYVGTDEVRIEGVTNNRRGSSLLDPVATLVRFDGVDGRAIATLFNFPIHGTVQGSGNLHLSSDVSGAIERRIEDLTGGVGFFLNGAEGDVSPSANEGDGAWDRAQILGHKIADAIVMKRNTMVVAPARVLAHFGQEIDLPRAKINIGTCFKKHGLGHIYLRLSRFLPRRAPFHGVLIDDTAFVTVAGEPITELGLRIKEFGYSLGFKHVGVVGLTDDHLGYILTPEEFRKGGAESCASLYGDGLGDLIQGAAEDVLTALTK